MDALESQRLEVKRQRAVNESICTLLDVVKYLNQVQDGDALRIDHTYSKTEIDKPARVLNCHEEDIMNASLITMKRLIETLLPPPTRPAANTGSKANGAGDPAVDNEPPSIQRISGLD